LVGLWSINNSLSLCSWLWLGNWFSNWLFNCGLFGLGSLSGLLDRSGGFLSLGGTGVYWFSRFFSLLGELSHSIDVQLMVGKNSLSSQMVKLNSVCLVISRAREHPHAEEELEQDQWSLLQR